MRVTARSVCTAAMVCVCVCVYLPIQLKQEVIHPEKRKGKKIYIIEYLSVKHHIIVTCKL